MGKSAAVVADIMLYVCCVLGCGFGEREVVFCGKNKWLDENCWISSKKKLLPKPTNFFEQRDREIDLLGFKKNLLEGL